MAKVQIHPKPQKPSNVGNSFYFLVKASKIQEKIIDPEKEYIVYAEEATESKVHQ